MCSLSPPRKRCVCFGRIGRDIRRKKIIANLQGNFRDFRNRFELETSQRNSLAENPHILGVGFADMSFAGGFAFQTDFCSVDNSKTLLFTFHLVFLR